MPDLSHTWTLDLSAAPNGDLASADGLKLGTQRIIRRLMTAQGEYIWHPTYGAGLPQRVGSVRDDRVIKALIKSQIYKEQCVARTPAPVITLRGFINGLQVTIQYVDAFVQKPVTISFPVHAKPVSQSQQSAASLEFLA